MFLKTLLVNRFWDISKYPAAHGLLFLIFSGVLFYNFIIISVFVGLSEIEIFKYFNLIIKNLIYYIIILFIIYFIKKIYNKFYSNVKNKLENNIKLILLKDFNKDSKKGIKFYFQYTVNNIIKIYFILLLLMRGFFVYLNEKPLRLAIFNFFVTIIIIQSIFKKFYFTTIALMFPFFLLAIDFRSAVVADFFKRNPELINQLLPLKKPSQYLNNFGEEPEKGGIWKRRMMSWVRRGIDICGGPKMILPAVGVMVAGGVGLGLQHYHHTVELNQAERHHTAELNQAERHHTAELNQAERQHAIDTVQENRKWAVINQMSPDYQALPVDSQVRKTVDYVAKTGQFPVEK